MVRVPGYRSRGPSYSRHYHIFREVVGLERGPLSLVSTTEELLGRKSGGSCLENRDYARGNPPRWPRGTLYPQNFGTNFADKVSLVRYSSLANEGHRVWFVFSPSFCDDWLESHLSQDIVSRYPSAYQDHDYLLLLIPVAILWGGISIMEVFHYFTVISVR
jgi:hypothetical protein